MRLLPLLAAFVLFAPGVLAAPSDEPVLATRSQMTQLDHYEQEMEQRWRAFDRSCDTEAPFALMYLLTTRAVRDHIAAGHFDDNPFLVQWTIAFVEYYLEALDARAAGLPASPAWQEAFDWGDTGMSTVGDDALLGMNAHINYDLALVTYEMGLPAEGRKADFDRINDVLRTVGDEISQEFGDRYDPSYHDTTGEELSGPALMALIETWREAAWHNAVRLEEASSQLERDLILAEITAHSVSIAKSVQVPRESQTEARVAYCESS